MTSLMRRIVVAKSAIVVSVVAKPTLHLMGLHMLIWWRMFIRVMSWLLSSILVGTGPTLRIISLAL
ncbi:hypothetical protein DE146DRAFT_666609 [Phaeosphaeria sp. MPI-PUGE-AT-0046c]|nr:hypothetical protein DE146DRAFT_666609 [Phaeosphaeria sp. MPI-PUGE-AT-0046c]